MRLGARFKTRIVLFFVALSLLPVIFLFSLRATVLSTAVSTSGSAFRQAKWSRMRSEIHNAYVAGEREQLKTLCFDHRSTSWKPGYRQSQSGAGR